MDGFLRADLLVGEAGHLLLVGEADPPPHRPRHAASPASAPDGRRRVWSGWMGSYAPTCWWGRRAISCWWGRRTLPHIGRDTRPPPPRRLMGAGAFGADGWVPTRRLVGGGGGPSLVGGGGGPSPTSAATRGLPRLGA